MRGNVKRSAESDKTNYVSIQPDSILCYRTTQSLTPGFFRGEQYR